MKCCKIFSITLLSFADVASVSEWRVISISWLFPYTRNIWIQSDESWIFGFQKSIFLITIHFRNTNSVQMLLKCRRAHFKIVASCVHKRFEFFFQCRQSNRSVQACRKFCDTEITRHTHLERKLNVEYLTSVFKVNLPAPDDYMQLLKSEMCNKMWSKAMKVR